MLHKDGTKYSDGLFQQSALLPTIPHSVEARIDEVIYTDDKRNSTFNKERKEVEYHCTIVGGPYDGVRLFNVKDSVDRGGKFNMSGSVRTPVQTGKLEPPIDRPQSTDGEFVMVSFLNNNPYMARIVKGIPHPQGTSQDVKKSDGVNSVFEYNGISVSIDKNGALTIGFGGGPKDKNGQPANSSAAGGSISVDKDGNIIITDGSQKLEISKANKKISIEADQNISTKAGGAWSIEVSGNVEVKAGGSLSLSGSVTQVNSGGNLAARVGDLITGTDSRGGPVTGMVQTGSGSVLIGG